MANSFDIDGYLQSRTARDTKLAELAAASKEKVVQLSQMAAASAVPTAPDNSWSTQLGLDPGSFTSNRVNDAASLISGAARLAGQVTSLPLGAAALVAENPVNEGDYAAHNRVVTNTAQPGDAERLNRRPEPNLPTVQERIAFAQKLRGNSKSVNDFFDLTGVVQQSNRNALGKDLVEGFDPAWDKTKAGWNEGKPQDVVSGVATLLMNAGSALLSNPSGVREYIVENAPQLMVGMFGKAGMAAMSASNVGYAVDYYNLGIQNYQAKNGGALPPEELRQQMAWQSAQLALAEQAGDMVGVGAAKIAGKVAGDATRTGFLASIKNATKAAAEGAVSEAPTEGYQTYLEGEITGKPATGAEIFSGAAIGAASGAGLTGGLRLAAELAGATPEQVQGRQKANEELRSKIKVMTDAVTTGDVSALTDPKSPNYSPSKAIGALIGNSQNPNADLKTKEANLAKANEIVAGLEERKAVLSKSIEMSTSAGLQAQIAAVEEVMAKEPAGSDRLATMTQMLAAYKTDLASVLASEADPRQKKALDESRKRDESKLQILEKDIENAKSALGGLNSIVKPAKFMAEQKAVINEPLSEDAAVAATQTEAKKTAVDKVISLSMESPEQVSSVDALEFANDKKNGLTEDQRSYLRAFSEARIAENALMDLQKVSQGVYLGEGKNKGIKQYREDITKALSTGNFKLADKEMRALQGFAQDHVDKAKAANEAFKQGKQVLIVRPKDGKWKVSNETLTPAQRAENGALLITRTLADSITQEAKALKLAFNEANAAYKLKLGNQESSNVTNVSQTQSVGPTAEAATQSGEPATNAGSTVEKPVTGGDSGTGKGAGRDASNDSLAAAGSVPDEGVDTEAAVAPATPASVAAVEPVVAPTPVVEPASPAIKADEAALSSVTKSTQELTKNSSYTKMTTVSEALLSENADLGTLLELLGVIPETTTVPTEGYKQVPSEKELLVIQTKLIAAYASLIAGTKTLADLKTELAGLFSWYVPTSTSDDNTERENRARKSAWKYGGGNTEAHYVIQLAEEVGEFLAEVSKLDGSSKLDPLKLEVQKRALKVLRFGADTVNKGEGVYKGLTNKEALKKAQEDSVAVVAASTPVEEPKTVDQSTTEEESPQTEEVAVAEESGLRILTKKSPEGTSFTERVGLIADFFHQVWDKATQKTEQALVSKRDFLTAWVNKEVSVKGFVGLPQDEPYTQEEANALKHLQKKLVEWNALLKKNLVRSNKLQASYKTQDMMQYLLEDIEGGVDLEENIKTAMSYAAYQWLMLKTSSNQSMSREEILGMHGKPSDGYLSDDGELELRDVAGFETTIIAELGQAAMKALGLKAKKGAPKNLQPRLESAMGVHILAMMEKAELIERNSDLRSTIEGYFIDPEGENEAGKKVAGVSTDSGDNVKNKYVWLNKENGKLAPELLDLRTQNKGSYDIVNKVFGTEENPRYASTEPQTFVQQFAKKTKQNISKLQNSVLDATMKTPHTAIVDMHALTTEDGLGKDLILQIAGFVDMNSTPVHEANILSVDAQNQNLTRQYDLMVEMLENPRNNNGILTEFYVTQEVWKNFRAGFITQSLNQQTSKIHRFMFARPSWKTTIKFDGSEETERLIGELMISAAQNMGLKTDKKLNEKTQIDFENHIAKPDIRAAIDAMKRFNGGVSGVTLTAEEKAVITKVSKEAEGMMTLQALSTWAKYENALDAKAKSVDITLLVGADGKTSGPMLTHLALGAAKTWESLFSTLNRGGMYSTADDQAKHFSEYAQNPGSRDLYEDLMSAVKKTSQGFLTTPEQIEVYRQKKMWKEFFTSFTGAQWNAFELITKKLSIEEQITGIGRNMVKTPLTAFGFGSSLKRATKSMENKFIESLYSTIEDIAKDKRGVGSKEPLTIEAYWASVNTLLKMGKAGGQIQPMDIKASLKYKFTKQQEAALRSAFDKMMGNPAKIAFNTYFASFNTRRTNLNKTIQAGFNTYQVIYQYARIKEIERLVAAGEIEGRVIKGGADAGKTEPVHDMNSKQEDAFRKRFNKLLPVMHTAYSLEENDNQGGLYMAKTESQGSDLPLYQVQSALRTGILSSNGKMSPHLAAQGVIFGEVSPGVSGMALSIHSLDSYAIHWAMNKIKESMNVHDEIGTGIGNIAAAAMAINEGIAQGLLNYSPAAEALKTFERLVLETVKGIAKGSIDMGVVPIMFSAWADTLNHGVPEDMHIGPEDAGQMMMSLAFGNAKAADSIRLGALANMAVMDQYPWEGGSFVIPPGMRKEAFDQLRALPDSPSELLVAAINELDDIFKKNGATQLPTWAKKLEDSDVQEQDIADISVLSVPPVQAMQLLEQVIADERVDSVLRNAAQQVLDTMIRKGTVLKDTVMSILTKPQALDILPMLAERLSRIPETMWGEVGTPTITSDADLVQFFEQNPTRTAGDLINFLSTPGRLSPANRKILYALNKVVRKDLPIRYVTSATAESQVNDKPASKSRGWYYPAVDGEAIYFTSNEFVHSGLTAETVLHELVHAAVANIVSRELAAKAVNKNYTSDAYKLIEEISLLLDKAQDSGVKGYGPALRDIQEFIAWGMTNKEFQRDVLTKIMFESKTKDNALVTLWDKFIKALTGLFFKAPDENTTNGLAVLVSNVSGLFAEASKGRAQPTAGTSLSMVSQVDSYTTLDLHKALVSESSPLDPEFNDKLEYLLSGIVEKLHGPMGVLHAAMSKTAAGNPLAVWLKALAEGKAPFASRVVVSGIMSSAQEDHATEQIEATIRAAISGQDTPSRSAYKMLTDLFIETRERLKPQDFHTGNWATATPLEKQYAQEKYDLIFKIEKSNGDSSDYLARFAAMGLANQSFNKMLKVATKMKAATNTSKKTFTERLEDLFKYILSFLQESITGTWDGQHADAKLEKLVSQLVDIEAKHRASVKAQQDPNNVGLLEPMAEGTKKAMTYFVGKAEELAGSNFVRKSGYGFVRGTGAVARVFLGDRVQVFMNDLLILKEKTFKGHPGMIAGLLKEVVGHEERFKFLLLATKFNEKNRKTIITSASKTALGMFIDQGKKLSEEAKKSISYVFLRSGAHNLLGMYSLDQIGSMLGDPVLLVKNISALESQLTGQFKYDYIEDANALGYQVATGIARDKLLKLNAYSIAARAGTNFMSAVSEAEVQRLEPILAALVSLNAINYMGDELKTSAKQVLNAESQRAGENGVQFILQLHKQLEKESKDRLFRGNPLLMAHGYTPEIYNPNVDVLAATELAGKDLENRGYVKGKPLWLDPGDPEREVKYLYVRKTAALMPYVSGAMSTKRIESKGQSKHDGYVNPHSVNGLANALMQADLMNDRVTEITSVRAAAPKRDLSKNGNKYLVPIYNDSGEVVNWRYLMEENTKDVLLLRNNRFEHVMGMLAGSIYDKESSAKQNKKVVEGLLDQFNEDYASNPDRYSTIGPKVTDPKLREIWKMLPKETQQYVVSVWGKEELRVRSDSLHIIFGARKLTAAKLFDTKQQERENNIARKAQGLPEYTKSELNLLQNIFVNVIENMFYGWARYTKNMSDVEAEKYSKMAAYKVSQGEAIWQEIVAETKDIIVVKTGTVMLGNISSNLTMLKLKGVPLVDIAKSHLVALKAATKYQADTKELSHLKYLRDAGYMQGKNNEIEQQIMLLEDALARNPVKELIDAGLMPTIVEDINPDDDIYSYKKALVTKVEKWTSKLPTPVVNAAKTVYMSHDGAMYQNLSRITQLSDFVARYTLYQHLTTRKVDPMSKKEAIGAASDAFVSYDIPMQPGMQYLDDMGITMFTKYFLRIQKEIAKIVRENPVGVLTEVALSMYMDLIPTVLDSSWIAHFGNNPIRYGATQYFGTLDNLATVNAAMALIK